MGDCAVCKFGGHGPRFFFLFVFLARRVNRWASGVWLRLSCELKGAVECVFGFEGLARERESEMRANIERS